MAYSDSVLYSLPILAETPGGHLVDMTRIFMSDDELVGRMLGASFVFDRSTRRSVRLRPLSPRDQVRVTVRANLKETEWREAASGAHVPRPYLDDGEHHRPNP